MAVGGNLRARQFFKQHGWDEVGSDKIEAKVRVRSEFGVKPSRRRGCPVYWESQTLILTSISDMHALAIPVAVHIARSSAVQGHAGEGGQQAHSAGCSSCRHVGGSGCSDGSCMLASNWFMLHMHLKARVRRVHTC